jgi:hypothetical protein
MASSLDPERSRQDEYTSSQRLIKASQHGILSTTTLLETLLMGLNRSSLDLVVAEKTVVQSIAAQGLGPSTFFPSYR